MIFDKNGNPRMDHSHTVDHDFWDGPFTLTEEVPCDDCECFGTLPDGSRDIRDLAEESDDYLKAICEYEP